MSTNPQASEPNPNPQNLTQHPDPSLNSKTGVDYEPNPAESLQVSPQRQHIVNAITSLYSGSASESDMRVYAPDAIYDDPWSYCKNRYEIAGQWYGIPKIFNSRTLATQIVASDPERIVYKQRQQYNPRGTESEKTGKVVNSLVTLSLNEREQVTYHKEMWNEKDYSHEGLGKLMKTLNGEKLTYVTRPPESLKHD